MFISGILGIIEEEENRIKARKELIKKQRRELLQEIEEEENEDED